MVAILREADRSPVAEVAKIHGISDQTIYGWRKQYGAMDANEVKRLYQIEQENARPKKILAERDPEIEVMQEIAAKKMVSAPTRRRQVEFAKVRGPSERRACALMSVARYQSRMQHKSAPGLAAMGIFSAQYPRYGYRRIQVFLERQGYAMSGDRAWRHGWPTGAEEAHEMTRRHRATTAAATVRRASGVGVLLRLRCVRQRPAIEMSDGDR